MRRLNGYKIIALQKDVRWVCINGSRSFAAISFDAATILASCLLLFCNPEVSPSSGRTCYRSFTGSDGVWIKYLHVAIQTADRDPECGVKLGPPNPSGYNSAVVAT